jgi:hypothetical protein
MTNPDEKLLFAKAPKAAELNKQAKRMKRTEQRKSWWSQHGNDKQTRPGKR